MFHIAKFTVTACSSIGSITIAMDPMEWALCTYHGIKIKSI